MIVTGAAGYVGGRLVGTLLAEGRDVHALVPARTSRLEVEQTVGDLAGVGVDELGAACRGADAIVHLAGDNEVVAAARPAAALARTVVATEQIAEAAARAEVPRLVSMSTVHVYGTRIREGAVLTEDLRPEPRSTYAISRLASEHLAAALTGSETDLVVLRLTNAVGAPDDPAVDRWTLVANDLCRQGALERRLTLRSSGVQWRDFVPLGDVCAMISAAAGGAGPPLPAGTYNLASGRPTTVRALAEMIQDAFERHSGQRPDLQAPEPGPGRPAPYHVSVDRLAGHGAQATTDLADAVDETVRFCLEHREALV